VKGAVTQTQTTLQGKVGYLVAVIDDCKQLHTNATLLKPAEHYKSFQSSKGL